MENNGYIIRLETKEDYAKVETLTRNAFWNVYKPGADEHYFVHMMRNHPDFIPELAFVLEKDGEIIGNIMYTKAWLEDEDGNKVQNGLPYIADLNFPTLKVGNNLISVVVTNAEFTKLEIQAKSRWR